MSGRGAYPIDQDKVQRLAKRVAEFLADFFGVMDEYASRSITARLRLLGDLKDLLASVPPAEQEALRTLITSEVEAIFRDGELSATPGKFPATMAMRVSGHAGCIGAEGATVTVSDGNTTVGVCVTGDLETGPTGGGLEAEVRY
jgi:hypothetical protein